MKDRYRRVRRAMRLVAPVHGREVFDCNYPLSAFKSDRYNIPEYQQRNVIRAARRRVLGLSA